MKGTNTGYPIVVEFLPLLMETTIYQLESWSLAPTVCAALSQALGGKQGHRRSDYCA
jgi:hypothetical protein